MCAIGSGYVRLMRRSAFRAAVSALAAIVVVVGFAPASSAAPALGWQLVDTGSSSHFRGLAAVSRQIAWVSGYDGTVLRTTDGGRTWSDVSVPGAQSLQFRDITAFSARRAVVMAAGSGTDSRLYVTRNGGATWRLSYKNTDPAAFFDCMAFFDPRHGLVMSDPVDGKFRILQTSDGGAHWTVLPSDGMPPAGADEFGFAASGECLTTHGHDAWFGSGGGDGSRVFHSHDGGLTWQVQTTPIVRGASAGIFGLAFANSHLGIAVGGDFSAPTASKPRGGGYRARGTPGGRRRRARTATAPGSRSSAVQLAWRSRSGLPARTSPTTTASTGPSSTPVSSTPSPAPRAEPAGHPATSAGSPC